MSGRTRQQSSAPSSAPSLMLAQPSSPSSLAADPPSLRCLGAPSALAAEPFSNLSWTVRESFSNLIMKKKEKDVIKNEQTPHATMKNLEL